ncbi:hypothetical protein GS610_16100 [Ruegeria sp. HKCCD6228]|uniref:TIR domain-containing protein n=1 Tax=Ruegeria sp. HKCCD6228 TaxID=2683001 RepID=UPI0014929D69|nr:nucleotide-binding protein [Ruegeria sp. HKCCD6228]NOD98731.1 hypothetical protein [Ruegeria sp. HKCCD6228]
MSSKQKTKFHGTIEELKGHVSYVGRDGDWSGDEAKYVFKGKSPNKEILNWWPKTGTLQFQGGNPDGFRSDLAQAMGSAATFKATAKGQRRIFVVHGSDNDALDQLQLVLYKLGVEPLVQKDVDGKGQSLFSALMENITNESDFAIVLMTPDDWGYRNSETETEKQPRARQNVILEAGMALSKLGSDRVAIIKKGALEIPSDLEGLIRIEYNSNVKEVASKIAQRLNGAGIPIDQTKVIAASQ